MIRVDNDIEHFPNDFSSPKNKDYRPMTTKKPNINQQIDTEVTR